MAAGDQDAIQLADEPGDGVVVHLRQPGAPLAATLALVAVRKVIEHAAVLRIEERRRNRALRQSPEQLAPIHPQPRIERQLRRQRKRRLLKRTLTGEDGCGIRLSILEQRDRNFAERGC